jgi:hypothetical protein
VRRLNRSERGSLAIELVLAIPLLVMACILLIEGLLAVSAVNVAGRAARDGARVAAAQGDGAAAAREQLPDWLQVQEITIGGGGGCAGVCSTVRVGIPVGLPGFAAITYIPVARTADFPV